LDGPKEGKYAILCDRGILDGKAYVPPEVWQTLLDEYNAHEVHWRELRYDGIIHLVSSADGAEKYYIHDNMARSESLVGARELDEKLRWCW